ncbi:MAG: hypothetical protein ACSLFK_08280 [Gemmatimonadaceae bacterium]
MLVARTWVELEKMLGIYPVTLVVLDPSADGASRTVEFEQVKDAFPSLPIIAYVPLTPSAFRAVAHLSRIGLEHVILYSQDDSAERMIAMFDRVRVNPLTERFIHELQPRLDRLPVAVSLVVKQMFSEPYRYPNAQDLAVCANMSVVRLYRAFHAAGFAAPKKMVVAARLLRAYACLRDPGQSVGGVAKKLAYRNPRIFAEHSQVVLGLKPSRIASRLSEDEVVVKLLRSVVESNGHGRGPAF